MGSPDGSGADTDVQPAIEHNLFEDNGHDLYLYMEARGADGTKVLSPTIRYNTLRDATYGIGVADDQPYGSVEPTIAYNDFYGITGYAVNNATTRTITATGNYWGASAAAWDAGPQPGDTYGDVITSGYLTSSSAPILTRLEPATGQAGETITLHGANFGPAPIIGPEGACTLTNSAVTKYYYFGSTRVAMCKGTELYYLHGDHSFGLSLRTKPRLDFLNNRRKRRHRGAGTLPALRPGALDERPGSDRFHVHRATRRQLHALDRDGRQVVVRSAAQPPRSGAEGMTRNSTAGSVLTPLYHSLGIRKT